MDLKDFRCFISESGIDIWTWIDMAVSVACADHENELKIKRDAIVQKLYATSRCRDCDKDEIFKQEHDVGSARNSERLKSGKRVRGNDEDDDELKEILGIKILLDDQNQSESSLIELLQRLVDMDTTFKALKETDIGRHVTKLRKHSSNEVRRLVKILVRKWKETVDEWVRVNAPAEEATQMNGDEKTSDEAHHDKGKLKHSQVEDQNYQETQNAKKQRTSQAMDFHNIPNTKDAIFTNNGGNFPVKYW